MATCYHPTPEEMGFLAGSSVIKAFALSGRIPAAMFTQGECPGLGAAALSGRVKKQPAIHHGRLAAKTLYNLLNFLKKN